MRSAKLTFEALLDGKRPSMVTLSPDGDRLAFVVAPESHPVSESPPRELWVGTIDGEQLGPLPGESSYRTLPSWSRDGSRLAFVSDRDGDVVPWVREPSGELREVGDLKGTTEALLWAPDGRSLLALVADRGSNGAARNVWKRVDSFGADADPVVQRPDQTWRRLFRIDVESGETTEVSPPGVNIWEVGWNGGAAVAIVSSGPTESDYFDASIALLDLDARTQCIVHEAEWQLQAPVISPDGRHIAFVEGWASDRAPTGLGWLTVVELATGDRRQLAPELHIQSLRWLPDGSLFYFGHAGIEMMCGRVLLDGTVVPIWQGPATLGESHRHNASISDDGRIVAAPKEAPGEPPEVMVLDVGRADAGWRPLTDLNGALRELAAPHAERFTWQSDGVEIEGFLLTPPDHRGDERLPIVAFVHGGPMNAWTMNYSSGYLHLGTPLANHGYAVLFPNPRGSSGRGREFAYANLGQHGPMEVADVIAGVEALHEAGVGDRDRAGIIGLSGGGYATAYAVTRSHAFKAAVSMSCVSNWLSFHLTTSIGRFDEIVLQSDPYDPDGNHIRLSPVMYARDARTPTLILHGALDLCTPLGQAQELYQALVEAGVETELIAYQQAGHRWYERDYLLDTWARVSAWFDRHLAV